MKTKLIRGAYKIQLTVSLIIGAGMVAQAVRPPAARTVPGTMVLAQAGEVDASGPKAKSETTDGADQISRKKQIKIEAAEPDDTGERNETKEVAWLGVVTEESPEALGSQLGLQAGEGLLITYVATNSPASTAGLKKNDLLTEFDGQRLVLPAQLRKLVQMRSEGDKVKLMVYRSGQKQELSATLGKTKANLGLRLDSPDLKEQLGALRAHLHELPSADILRQQMQELHDSLTRAGVDKQKLESDIRRGVEEATRAVAEALKHVAGATHSLGSSAKVLEALASNGIQVNKDATVTIKSRDNTTRTMVKSDDTGSYVIVANPTKRLIAHDKNGKLLFDGEIETSEQQSEVPAEVWKEVQPMIEQLKPAIKKSPDSETPLPKKTSRWPDRSFRFRAIQAIADARTFFAMVHYMFERDITPPVMIAKTNCVGSLTAISYTAAKKSRIFETPFDADV